MNDQFFFFPILGIVVCEFHKEKRVQKDPRQEFETVEPGFKVVTEWCSDCVDIIIHYEKEVD
jgi:hypothetical protein